MNNFDNEGYLPADGRLIKMDKPTKITNYERIKNMSLDELAEFLKQHCALLVAKKAGSDFVDKDLIKQWLRKECEE